jgi:uncharacterized membrane protein (UPF0136 family)
MDRQRRMHAQNIAITATALCVVMAAMAFDRSGNPLPLMVCGVAWVICLMTLIRSIMGYIQARPQESTTTPSETKAS